MRTEQWSSPPRTSSRLGTRPRRSWLRVSSGRHLQSRQRAGGSGSARAAVVKRLLERPPGALCSLGAIPHRGLAAHRARAAPGAAERHSSHLPPVRSSTRTARSSRATAAIRASRWGSQGKGRQGGASRLSQSPRACWAMAAAVHEDGTHSDSRSASCSCPACAAAPLSRPAACCRCAAARRAAAPPIVLHGTQARCAKKGNVCVACAMAAVQPDVPGPSGCATKHGGMCNQAGAEVCNQARPQPSTGARPPPRALHPRCLRVVAVGLQGQQEHDQTEA